MFFKISPLKKCLTCAAFAIPLALGTMQPAYSATRTFGHPYGGGTKADIPRLSGNQRRIISACVDGWVDSVRYGGDAQKVIAYQVSTTWGSSQLLVIGRKKVETRRYNRFGNQPCDL